MQSIDVKEKCLILLGENETGKSNILKAISLLNPTVAINQNDIRDVLPEEPPVDEGYVRFVFAVDDEQISEIYNKILGHILCEGGNIGRHDGREITLHEFCKSRNEVLYRIDIIKNSRNTSYWKLGDGFSINENYRSVRPNANHSIKVNGEDKNIKDYKIIDISTYKDIPEEYLEEASIEMINEYVGVELKQLLENNIPKCVVWTYSESNILPGKIDLNVFKSNVNSCVPLKNMFGLTKIENITEEINQAMTKTNGMRNLLNRVAECTTKHIKNVWKDRKDIDIHLALNGNFIEAGVEDKHNIFDLSRRSDGFKRFLTFMLLISAQDRIDELQDNILIIDEPDIGLHPSGSKYLRDELIKISKRNNIFYSTHSIFMIDRENIGRHLLIKKRDEITTLEHANESNIKDEEVLYNSLGFSIFEMIQMKNIIFEGWRDKYIFEIVKNATRSGKKTEKIGLCFSQGVKDIDRVASLLDLAGRQYIIISDADSPALEKKSSSPQKDKWFTYNDILNENKYVSGEDFIDIESSIKAFNSVLPRGELKIAREDINEGISIISQLDAFLSKNNLNADKKTILSNYKEKLYSGLSKAHITKRYDDVVSAIYDKFKNLRLTEE